MKINEVTNKPTIEDANELFESVSKEYGALLEYNEAHDITDELTVALNDALSRMAAAKRALGLAGKLKPGPSREKHTWKVMMYMNSVLRPLIAKLNKEMKKASKPQEEPQSFD